MGRRLERGGGRITVPGTEASPDLRDASPAQRVLQRLSGVVSDRTGSGARVRGRGGGMGGQVDRQILHLS